MKIAVIFGTRPEAIKLAPVILELHRDPDFGCHVCVTAQHREMLDQVLDVFGIVPDVDLDLMQPGQTLASLTSRLMTNLDSYLAATEPDWVIVQGDTTTAFVATLAAFYCRIPVLHVEAGLRTGNLYSPWPEEGNRVLIGRLASLHCAPTELAKQNLLSEGTDPVKIAVTGNTVIDALKLAVKRARRTPPVALGIAESLLPLFAGDAGDRRLILVTAHRRESFGAEHRSICQAIRCLAAEFPECEFAYPVHLNPNVQETVYSLLQSLPNVHLLAPLPYLAFVALMDRCFMILTDSGGIQEEAPSLGKPVLVMRNSTERMEAVEAGGVQIVGTDRERILHESRRLLRNPDAYASMVTTCNPYGDGRAAERILGAIRTTQVHNA